MKRKMAVMAIAACVALASVSGSAGTGTLEVDAAPKLTVAAKTATQEDADGDEAEETEETAAEDEGTEEEEETEEAEDTEETEESADDGEGDESGDEEETSGVSDEESEEEASDAAEEEEETDDDAGEEASDAQEDAGDVTSEEESAEEDTEEDTEEETEDEAEEDTEDLFDAVGFEEDAVITVTGTGAVTVTPESASISIGVETTSASSREAQAENSETVNAVIDALLEAGVTDKSIQTDSFDIYTNYDYSGDTVELAGYIVTTSLTVSNLDLGEVGDLLDAATEAGANSVNGIYYSYGDAEEAYDDALDAALERAQDKAELIAAKQGAQLKAVVSIEEESFGYNVSDARSVTTSTADGETEGSAMTVMGGESEITATVSVTYSLEELPEEEL